MTFPRASDGDGRELEIVDPLRNPQWDDLVRGTAGSSVFHTSAWARVLHDSYGYRPRYVVSVSHDRLDVLVPFMEIDSIVTGRRGVSLPFTDYCEPVVAQPGRWESIQARIREQARTASWKYIELRGGEGYLGGEASSSSFYHHVLPLLPDPDRVYERVKSSTKRNIQKAQREGVVVTERSDEDAVRIFYRLHCLTRKRHGVPPQPFRFFEMIHRHVIRQGLGAVYLAEYRGAVVGGAVYFHFGTEALYKFGASDSAYQQARPNDALMWEAIKRYCRNGYRTFSFGRTDTDNEGLRKFKLGWGAEEQTIRYYQFDLGTNRYRPGQAGRPRLATMLFQRMPIFLLKFLGKALYRHIG